MRSSQYIGLTNAASEFVKEMERTNQPANSFGMFDENIPLCTYSDGKEKYVETVQITPWSSGPMFFTCLVRLSDGEKLFKWVENESVYGEVDYSNGLYWV